MADTEQLLTQLVERFKASERERRELFGALQRMKQAADEALAPRPDLELSELRTLAEVEKEHILRVLEATGRHKADTAQILGISISNLHLKLVRHGIEAPSHRRRQRVPSDRRDQAGRSATGS